MGSRYNFIKCGGIKKERNNPIRKKENEKGFNQMLKGS